MGLVRSDHTALARWAADCAAHVLPHFERHTQAGLGPFTGAGGR